MVNGTYHSVTLHASQDKEHTHCVTSSYPPHFNIQVWILAPMQLHSLLQCQKLRTHAVIAC